MANKDDYEEALIRDSACASVSQRRELIRDRALMGGSQWG